MSRAKFDLLTFPTLVYCMRNENEAGLPSLLLSSINLEFHSVVRTVKT